MSEHNLDQGCDQPLTRFDVLHPPGPLSGLFAIAFGREWEVAKRGIAGLVPGDEIRVRGVLYPGAGEKGPRFLLVLEDLEKVENPGHSRLRGRDR